MKKTLFERAVFVFIWFEYTPDKQRGSVALNSMIHVQRAAAGLVVLRRYGTYSLQQRISELYHFIRLSDASSDPSWHSVTTLPTLDSAVAHLESIVGPSTPSALSPSHPPPTWLLVRLCSKVHSQADAAKASLLIITYLPYVPSDLRPPVLILTVHLLFTYRVLPALERVIKLFIGLPIFHDAWHFNRLLRALTLYTECPTDGRFVARQAILLLKTMTERELSLTKKTYRLLLRNRFIAIELSDELRQRMIRDKIVPDRAHLESLLRISAHRGLVPASAAYVSAIHRLEQDDPPASEQAPPPGSETDQIVPSTAVEYLTHLVHENAQRKQFDADAEWLRFTKTGRSHRFLNNQKSTSAAAWGARLFSLSRTWSFSSENLVMFFDWSHAQRFPFRTHTTLSYTIVILGLIRRCAYSLALEIWERYRSHGTRKLRIDAIALGIGVEAMVRAGHPERALALLMNINSPLHVRPKTRRTLGPLLDTASRQTVPLSVVNRFMRVLGVTNPSTSLHLWEHMGTLYAATPNANSFAIMLNAARHATVRGDSFAGAMQELGFDLRLRLPFSKPYTTTVAQSGMESTPMSPESLDRARHRCYEKLKNSLAVSEGDMWGGERAWRRAHRIFTSALLAGYPVLADVRAPVRAIRSSGESPALAPFRDLKNFLRPSRPQPHTTMSLDKYNSSKYPEDDLSPSDDPNPPLLSIYPDGPNPPLLPIHPRGAYLSFAPDDATFLASVLLLGMARCAGQIPLMLAWMRALDIKPRRSTLAYALVFWAEVTIGAPLLEGLRLRGRHEDGEYVRFVRWMEEWVGLENVPDEAAVGEAMRRVDRMRYNPQNRR